MACEMIHNHKKGNRQPPFPEVSFARPHSPYDPPQRLSDLYKGRDVPAPFIGEWCKEKDYARLTKVEDAPKDAASETLVKNMQKTHAVTITPM